MPDTVVAEAAGRVNLIGEHTDYHAGFVLPTLIPQRTRVQVTRRDDRRIRAFSTSLRTRQEYEAGHERPGRGWLDYIQGVTALLARGGSDVPGFDVEITSTVPVGASVSSSAALTVSLLRALRSLLALDLGDTALAKLAQAVEIEFVGAPVGIMDQMAVSVGREGQALFLDTRTLEYETLSLTPDADLIVIDSGVTHSGTGANGTCCVKPVAVVIATMTLARDRGEERLLLQSLIRLSECEWPIVVTDGGSSAAFTDRLRDVGGIEVHRADGLVPQITRSIEGALAHDAPIILYIEPDKLDFFDAHVESFVARAREHGPCLATRSVSSFRTYPAHQQVAETTINRRCGEVFDIAGDFSYGPFVLPRSLAIDLRAMPAHLGWGWRHFAFAMAHRLGYRITMVEGDFTCPPGQRDEDENDRAHRNRQLHENLEGLALGLTSHLHR